MGYLVSKAKIVFSNYVFGENTRYRNFIDHPEEFFAGSKLTEFQKREIIDGVLNQGVYATPDPDYILGFDDSHWGGVLTLDNSYEHGIRFIFFKATDGTVNTKYWDVNFPNALSREFLVSSYHWLYRNANVSCKAQAQAFWNRIKVYPITIPPVVDWEWTYFMGQPANPDWNDLDIFLTEFLRISGGVKPLLYTAGGYANQFGEMPASIKNKIAGLFIANYGVTKPYLPIGFTDWEFWQFTPSLPQNIYAPSSTGKLELDGDYYRRTLDDLYRKYGYPQNPAPTPPPDITVTHTGISQLSLNVRAGAGTQNSTLTVLYKGDMVYGTVDNDSQWFHLNKIQRVSGLVEELDGWCAILSGSTLINYLYVQDIDPTQAVVTYPYAGVEVHKIRYENATDVWITKIDLDIGNPVVQVHSNDHLQLPSEFEASGGFDIVANGDAWHEDVSAPYDTFGIASIDGVLVERNGIAPQKFVPALNVSKNNQASIIMTSVADNTLYNAFSGFRYLMSDGVIKDYLSDTTKVQYTERHPRRANGVNETENIIYLIRSEGRSIHQMGLTLLDSAKILKSFGAQDAFDSDSGRSANVRVGGVSQGTYEGGYEHPVMNMIGFKFLDTGGGQPPSNMLTELKLSSNSPTKSRSLRLDPPAGQSHVYGTGVWALSPSSYAKAYDEDKYRYDSNVVNAEAGDIWYKVREIDGVPLDQIQDADGNSIQVEFDTTGAYLWTAGIYLGSPQLDVSTVGVIPDPTPTFPTELWVSLEQGGTQQKYTIVP